MALKLLIFSDFICPFCYIGFTVVRKLVKELDLDLQWRGYQIHPEWPADGFPAEEFYRNKVPGGRRAIWSRIETMASDIQLPIKPPVLLTNSRAALEAAEFAVEAGRGEAFEERVYRAYFQENANIGKPDVIGELAGEVGIDRTALREALATGKPALRLKNNTLMARQRGVDGVPTFFVGRFPLVGAQSEETMRQMIRRAAQLAAQS